MDDAERLTELIGGERVYRFAQAWLAGSINAGSMAAMNKVYEYAHQFEDREDYEPLERLAVEVQRACVAAAAEALNDGEQVLREIVGDG